MDATAEQTIVSNGLTKSMKQLVERHMSKINDESRLEDVLEHQARAERMIHTKNKDKLSRHRYVRPLNQNLKARGNRGANSEVAVYARRKLRK